MAETSAHLGMRPIFSILCDRGCGSVGRAVASEIRGPRFEFIISNTVTCIEKTKIKKMKLVIAHFLKLKGVLKKLRLETEISNNDRTINILNLRIWIRIK